VWQHIMAASLGEMMIELVCLAAAFGVGWYVGRKKKK